MGLKLDVPYVTVWDGGSTVETKAAVNIKTGEITDIEISEAANNFDICERQYVIMNGEEVDVIINEEDDTYWIPLSNELSIGSIKLNEEDYYCIFVLGYDLLHERLLKSSCTECDVAFEICKTAYKSFLESCYNDNLDKSTYENLQQFVSDTIFDFEK